MAAAPAKEEPKRYAPVPHLNEYVKGDHHWIDNPIPEYFGARFRCEDEYVLSDIVRNYKNLRGLSGAVAPQVQYTGFLRGGPRSRVFFRPNEVRAAIVTCGGLCPGLNSVIREIFVALTKLYGVTDVWGVQYGYEGFYATKQPPRKLTADLVKYLHDLGGTMLGSSRGGFELKKIVDGIVKHGFTHIYIIGGDGTHRGAQAIYQEIKRRQLKIAVIGVPKTIDNDICLIDQSFGFRTAVCEAEKALKSAAVEADCAVNGICIVQLMGRQSGFVAANATLASREVDLCLVPEVKFDKDRLAHYVAESLRNRSRCVICMAEAAGLEYCQASAEKDASGNPRLPDVSVWLKSYLVSHIKKNAPELGEINCRLINPSYMIRSVPPNIEDRQYCGLLAIHAVHAAMAGYTGVTIGLVNGHYVWLPFMVIGQAPASLDPKGRIWQRVLELTGQPDLSPTTNPAPPAKL